MKSIFPVVVLSFLLFSCKDKEAPRIEFVSPQADAHYSVDGLFDYNISVFDDRGLSYEKHYIASDVSGTTSPDFVSSGSGDISGKKNSIQGSGSIGTSVPGTYYFYVEVTDKSGKTTVATQRFFVD